jgi:hypothetical protein
MVNFVEGSGFADTLRQNTYEAIVSGPVRYRAALGSECESSNGERVKDEFHSWQGQDLSFHGHD